MAHLGSDAWLVGGRSAQCAAPLRQGQSFGLDVELGRIDNVIDQSAKRVEDADVAPALASEGNKRQCEIRSALACNLAGVHTSPERNSNTGSSSAHPADGFRIAG